MALENIKNYFRKQTAQSIVGSVIFLGLLAVPFIQSWNYFFSDKNACICDDLELVPATPVKDVLVDTLYRDVDHSGNGISDAHVTEWRGADDRTLYMRVQYDKNEDKIYEFEDFITYHYNELGKVGKHTIMRTPYADTTMKTINEMFFICDSTGTMVDIKQTNPDYLLHE